MCVLVRVVLGNNRGFGGAGGCTSGSTSTATGFARFALGVGWRELGGVRFEADFSCVTVGADSWVLGVDR